MLKLFLWPLVVWLAATRRFVAAGLTLAVAAVATMLAWLVIGLDGFADYPELVRKLTDVVGDRGYSLDALAAASGAGAGVVPVAAGAAAVLGGWSLETGWRSGGILLAIRGGRLDADRLAALLHAAPRSNRARTAATFRDWFLPLLYWATPFQETDGDLWRIVLGMASTLVAFWPAWSESGA